MTRIYWTEDNLQIVQDCITRYGVSAGCAVAAKKLDSSYHAVQSQYYKKLYSPKLAPKVKRGAKRLEIDDKGAAKYLTKQLQNNPDNVHLAAHNTAVEYNVSDSYILSRYYGTTPRRDKSTDPLYRFNLPLSICTVGGSKALYNGKQSTGNTKEIKKTSWILTLLNKIFKYGEN